MKKIITTDYYGKQYEVPVTDLRPSIHVYGIAINNGEALISPQFDGYDWPGGTFQLGEDTIQTLKREFKEETGFEVEPLRLLHLETSLFHHPKSNTDHHSLLVFYLVEIVGGELSDAGFDTDEQEYAKLAQWVPLEQLRQMHHACSVDIADKILDLALQAKAEVAKSRKSEY